VTKAFLLGCVAQRVPAARLEWDAAKMRFTSSERANRLVDPPYRSDYSSTASMTPTSWMSIPVVAYHGR